MLSNTGSVSWSDVAQRMRARDYVPYVRELELVGLICLKPDSGYVVNTRAGVPRGADWFEEIEEEIEEDVKKWERAQEWDYVTDVLTSGDYDDTANFQLVSARIPTLAALLERLSDLPATTSDYCALDAWWGRGSFNGHGVHDRIKQTIEQASRQEPFLPADLILGLASRHLARAMPRCHIGHEHEPARLTFALPDNRFALTPPES